MDKKILQQIRQFAAMLPKTSTPCMVRVSGDKIIEVNPDAKDSDGNAVSREKVYKFEGEILNNHYRTMKKIYKKEGANGLNRYAAMMKEFVDGREKMLVDALGGMAERKNTIASGF